MNFEKEFKKPTSLDNIDYHSKIIQIGSCFSENISEKLNYFGFNVFSNPFGVVFHPIALAKQILWAIDPKLYEKQIAQKEDIYLHFQASSSLYALSEEELERKFHLQLNQLKMELSSADYLFVSFGSAHGYLHSKYSLVANCHQQSKENFQKELSSIDEMKNSWKEVFEKLVAFNPKIKIVFTVSPVRYSRDGWIENNKSKSRLIELCHSFSDEISYFPSYEIVIDLLRDFRFYEKDGVHPNSEAIEAVWALFKSWFFSNETNEICSQLDKLKDRKAHRLLYPDSKVAMEFQKETERLIQDFRTKFPQVIWRNN